jgi:hypothetical protein
MVANVLTSVSWRRHTARVPPATRTQQQAEDLLGESLEGWVVCRRAEGLSWNAITAELAECTNGQCDLHPETVRTWFAGVDPSIPLGHAI